MSYATTRIRRRTDSGFIAWCAIAGGIVGLMLGYLIANQLIGFDPLEILPLTIGR